MVLDIFALIVLGVLVAVVIWLVVVLGPMPGNIACKRGNPHSDAIRVLGWIGVITLGPAWLAALVWAYAGPAGGADLAGRVAALEDEVRRLDGARGGEAP